MDARNSSFAPKFYQMGPLVPNFAFLAKTFRTNKILRQAQI